MKTRASSRPPKSAPERVPGKRTRNKDATRKRILAAALDLFKKKGIAGTATREISRRAGIAEGTLFNYFKTKEDLALYFFERGTVEVMEWWRREKRLRSAPVAERLFAIIQRQLDYIAPFEDFIGAVIFRSLQPRSKLHPLSLESQELRLKYLKFVREVLAEAEERREIPPTGELGAYAFGLYHLGIVAHWLNDASPGKERTLALLDRSLQIGSKLLGKGGWEW